MKHLPRKRFGQNFLVDQGVIAGIVAAIAPQATDSMVEIGPGLGALTHPLLQKLDHLHVVEIDRDLIVRLKNAYSPQKMSIHEGDALVFDFAKLGSNLRLVGNLPYNISTPLLFHLADFAENVRDMHFMLQKEVVERMVAVPGDAECGRLSIMLQYRFHLDWLLDVPPESFDPPPKVQSAVVRMIPKRPDELTAKDEILLAKVVTMAFAQRRKMLRNTLRDLVSAELFTAAAIDPMLRAEDLGVADYVRLANLLADKVKVAS